MYFIANLKDSVKIETEIEKWNDYRKFVELSNLIRELRAKNGKGIGLKNIYRKIHQEGYLKNTFLFRLERKSTYYNEYEFYDTIEKKNQIAFYLFIV